MSLEQPSKPSRFLGKHILVVEDTPDSRELMAMLLTDAGASVTCANDGNQALQATKQQDFDLIVMDMQMPVLDGYHAATELRRQGAKMPILAVTAQAMAGDREKCIDAGCTDYLTKPIEFEGFLKRAAAHLSIARTTRETDTPAAPATAVAPKPMMTMEQAVSAFVNKLPDRATEIIDHVDRLELESLRRKVHQLKGAGGSFGFPEITTHAGQYEQVIGDAKGPSVASDTEAFIATLLMAYAAQHPKPRS